MKLQFIGWRVMAKTPRGGGMSRGDAPGWGKAGLPSSEPTSRMLANNMIAEASGHHQIGATHNGLDSSARHVTIIHTRVASATSE